MGFVAQWLHIVIIVTNKSDLFSREKKKKKTIV